ncbi:MAG TPA: 4Fe-4S dicluster domain-containing protein [Myxococcales bacterium]|nr:4Fe-4S dicluster domain-containing protein [Myxococcales bacterium]
MAELVPFPFDRLVSRMFRELERNRSIFDLEERRFVLGPGALDLSVRFHGKTAATPLGPAAGPQSQLAQNLVLSFLGGGRICELKTVQVNDQLKIPRPCIDMQTVGYNVEWSQELRLEQSLEEYVKGSMLLEMLAASGALPFAPGFDRFLFDMSVGYDLAGIQSEPVQAFLRGMRDARPLVDRLRRQIPEPWKRLRDLDFRTDLSDTLTLSTFHGCPPDEIERIMGYLLEAHGLHCIVKLNPTLLGKTEARALFNGRLGYEERIPDAAFDKDTRWEQAVAFVGRLGEKARGLGLGFGVKLTNTLIVENRRDFFPKSEKEMYLSGPPLHVLAVALVDRFRAAFGGDLPISFSAGIDQKNFPDAVALGLCPVTVCSDLLRPRGYGRMQGYFAELERRMTAVGARTIDEWVLRHGGAPAASLGEARCANAHRYAAALLEDPRYRRAANAKVPRKVGSRLKLLDCLTCDICVPVCPNDANFTFTLPPLEIPVVKLAPSAGGFRARTEGKLAVRERHQIGNVADACNECGNCDVFCPEDGGPYVLKPRFFGTLEHWRKLATHDGFHLERLEGRDVVHGRFEGREYCLEIAAGEARYEGSGFALRFAEGRPEQVLSGHADAEVDLTYFHLMNWIRRAILDGPEVTFLRA